MNAVLLGLLAMAASVVSVEASGKERRGGSAPGGRPVILVHGLGDKARKMGRLGRYLEAQGREVHNIALSPSWGQVGLDQLAEQLAAFIERTMPSGQRFDLVGFSMGGIVCRYYVQRLGGLDRVDRFVTISSPHHGSLLAWLIPNPGCRQMRPGSVFLTDLNRDAERLQRVQFTSFWTPLDLTIVPAWSSVMTGAQSRKIWCVAHPLMVWESRCLRAVAEVLER